MSDPGIAHNYSGTNIHLCAPGEANSVSKGFLMDERLEWGTQE